MAYFEAEISGNASFTRAYALATLHYLKYPETTLLPAVFISALDDATSFALWKVTSDE